MCALYTGNEVKSEAPSWARFCRRPRAFAVFIGKRPKMCAFLRGLLVGRFIDFLVVRCDSASLRRVGAKIVDGWTYFTACRQISRPKTMNRRVVAIILDG